MPPIRLLGPGIVAAVIALAVGILVLARAMLSDDPSAAPPDVAGWVSMASDLSVEGFAAPEAGWELSLPGDHGAHPDARTESWSLAVQLETPRGEAAGFQLSLLRLGLRPPESRPPESVWEIRDLYRGHVTFLGAAQDSARGEERFARKLPGLAGYDPAERELRLDTWSLRFPDGEKTDRIELQATIGGETTLHLAMKPQKPPLASTPGDGGAPFAGYSFTRLAVDGTVTDGNVETRVRGTAWFDHLWGELPLPGAGPVAWDRLQLQIDDGTDLSVLRSRRRDGGGQPDLSAVMVDPACAVSLLDGEALEMTPLRLWRHPGTGIDYPLGWTLNGPGLEIAVAPLTDAQAFDFAVPLWNGTVRGEGRHAGKDVTAVGTLQLTGYAAR